MQYWEKLCTFPLTPEHEWTSSAESLSYALNKKQSPRLTGWFPMIYNVQETLYDFYPKLKIQTICFLKIDGISVFLEQENWSHPWLRGSPDAPIWEVYTDAYLISGIFHTHIYRKETLICKDIKKKKKLFSGVKKQSLVYRNLEEWLWSDETPFTILHKWVNACIGYRQPGGSLMVCVMDILLAWFGSTCLYTSLQINVIL